MSIFKTVSYAFQSEVHEQKIGKRVDKLRCVLCNHIVLIMLVEDFSRRSPFVPLRTLGAEKLSQHM